MVTYNEAMRKAVENATPGSYEHAAQFWLGYARELRENFLTLSADNREQLGDEPPFPRRADIVHPFVMGEDSLCAATGCGGLQSDTQHRSDPGETIVIDTSTYAEPDQTLRISPLVRPAAPAGRGNGLCYCRNATEHVYGAPGCIDA